MCHLPCHSLPDTPLRLVHSKDCFGLWICAFFGPPDLTLKLWLCYYLFLQTLTLDFSSGLWVSTYPLHKLLWPMSPVWPNSFFTVTMYIRINWRTGKIFLLVPTAGPMNQNLWVEPRNLHFSKPQGGFLIHTKGLNNYLLALPLWYGPKSLFLWLSCFSAT